LARKSRTSSDQYKDLVLISSGSVHVPDGLADKREEVMDAIWAHAAAFRDNPVVELAVEDGLILRLAMPPWGNAPTSELAASNEQVKVFNGLGNQPNEESRAINKE
jgi:hypothetical protein